MRADRTHRAHPTRAQACRARVGQAFVAWCVLVLWVSAAAAADGARPAIGDEAPDFTLTSSDGETMTLSSMRGQKKVLLVFFRGTW